MKIFTLITFIASIIAIFSYWLGLHGVLRDVTLNIAAVCGIWSIFAGITGEAQRKDGLGLAAAIIGCLIFLGLTLRVIFP